MVKFVWSKKGEDYFRHIAKTRCGEKRRWVKWESRERLEGKEKRKASCVRRKGSRQQSEGIRMWRKRQGRDPGEVSMRLLICPSSARPVTVFTSIRIINMGWISSL